MALREDGAGGAEPDFESGWGNFHSPCERQSSSSQERARVQSGGVDRRARFLPHPLPASRPTRKRLSCVLGTLSNLEMQVLRPTFDIRGVESGHLGGIQGHHDSAAEEGGRGVDQARDLARTGTRIGWRNSACVAFVGRGVRELRSQIHPQNP